MPDPDFIGRLNEEIDSMLSLITHERKHRHSASRTEILAQLARAALDLARLRNEMMPRFYHIPQIGTVQGEQNA